MSAWKAWAELAVGGLVIAVSAIGLYSTAHPEISCAATANRVWLSDARACLPLNAFTPAR